MSSPGFTGRLPRRLMSLFKRLMFPAGCTTTSCGDYSALNDVLVWSLSLWVGIKLDGRESTVLTCIKVWRSSDALLCVFFSRLILFFGIFFFFSGLRSSLESCSSWGSYGVITVLTLSPELELLPLIYSQLARFGELSGDSMLEIANLLILAFLWTYAWNVSSVWIFCSRWDRSDSLAFFFEYRYGGVLVTMCALGRSCSREPFDR